MKNTQLILLSFINYPKFLSLLDKQLLRNANKYNESFGYLLNALYKSYMKDPLETYSIDNLMIEALKDDTLLNQHNKYIDLIPDVEIKESQAEQIIKEWVWDCNTKYIIPSTKNPNREKALEELRAKLMFAGESVIVIDTKNSPEKVEKELLTVTPLKDFSLGIPKLDEVLQGGMARQELGILQADTNVGKTWYVLNMAIKNALKGYNVLFVSLEMSLASILIRTAVLVFNESSIDLEADIENTKNRLIKHFKKMKGNLVLAKELPRKFTMHDLERLYKDIQISQNYTIDLIVLDYADLFALTLNVPRWQSIGDLYNQLKSFALEYNVGIMTASQLVRGAGNKEVTSTSDTSGSYDKARIADLICNLEETGEGAKRIRIKKTRTRGKETSVLLYPDFETGDLLGVNVNDLFKQ